MDDHRGGGLLNPGSAPLRGLLLSFRHPHMLAHFLMIWRLGAATTGADDFLKAEFGSLRSLFCEAGPEEHRAFLKNYLLTGRKKKEKKHVLLLNPRPEPELYDGISSQFDVNESSRTWTKAPIPTNEKAYFDQYLDRNVKPCRSGASQLRANT